ncbi:MAG: hypothetical protein HOV79_23365, partial [Hamadaea sp.]|nr:hypothetical protein [Hamadaea sp.]
MKPMEAWAGQATSWTRATTRWLDRWRSRDDLRFGGTMTASPRRGLGTAIMGMAAVGAGAGVLHMLLATALGSRAGLGWPAVALAAAIAAVLLAAVVRSTVFSLGAPQSLRTHAMALLRAIAALVAAV